MTRIYYVGIIPGFASDTHGFQAVAWWERQTIPRLVRRRQSSWIALAGAPLSTDLSASGASQMRRCPCYLPNPSKYNLPFRIGVPSVGLIVPYPSSGEAAHHGNHSVAWMGSRRRPRCSLVACPVFDFRMGFYGDTKSVSYDHVTALLAEVLKEFKNLFDSDHAELEKQAAQIKKLEDDIASLKAADQGKE